MKCWIASFPRSGNTFFRNILYYVYGLESSTWHRESTYPVDENYDQFPFVKTHLLPADLEPSNQKIPAIYLVRDGRDAMVSIAHHRKDIVRPGSDFTENLREAIVAAEGSFFGGWSRNVNEWIERADLIIKYEDLIRDPQAVFSRVERLIDMPKARWDNLPDFKSMKFGSPKYGGQTTSKTINISPEEFSKKFFRKGVAGSWKKEIPPDLLDLFNGLHGETMEKLGYSKGREGIGQNQVLDYWAMKKLGILPQEEHAGDEKVKILIESNKLQVSKNDGIKRYLIQLLKGFDEVNRLGHPRYHFDLLIANRIVPLSEYMAHIRSESSDIKLYEKVLLGVKKTVKNLLPNWIYEPLAKVYRDSPARSFLRQTRSKVSKKEEAELINKFRGEPGGYDLIHLPLPQNFRAVQNLDGNLVVTVHDITHRIFPEYHTRQNIEQTEEGMHLCLSKANRFLSISKNTTTDLTTQYPLDASTIDTVYEAADPRIFYRNFNAHLSAEVKDKYQIGSVPYFLCLSTIEPRKNLVNTVRGFLLFKENNKDEAIQLLIAGDKGWGSEHELAALTKGRSGIHFTGFVQDRDLHVLYSDALAFCYLSHYEGFGLPPLEAMSSKTPVLHSNRSSLSEVVGSNGLIADPDVPEDIAEKMEMLFCDADLRGDLAQKGFEHAMRFSWRKTVFQTLEVYQKCIR
jgi:glycosyltransferase involved in cell wall biosynthesis